jgi:hypothetical protein
LAPTVIYDDIVQFIHGKSFGTAPHRKLKWYKDTISEETVNMQISDSIGYLAWFVSSAWTSSDPNTQAACLRLARLYISAFVLCTLSGGLIITGFDKVTGDLALHASERGKIYMDVITPFLAEAESIRVGLTQFNLQLSPSGMAGGH